jgi:hypothetical protein
MKLVELYGDKVFGAIKGLDRVRFRGTLRWLANADGLRSFLSRSGVLLKDFKAWAMAKTAHVREGCAQQAEALGIPTLYLRSSAVDKDALARKIAQERGLAVGPICQFSVVETCLAPTVEGNRASKKLELNYRPRKCVFIYQYFDDPQVGFGHVRLQSWLPFGVTLCLNGRHWLEKQLRGAGLNYVKDGNCFPWLEDVAASQRLMDEQLQTDWPGLLERLLRQACPGLEQVLAPLDFSFYWSAEESEWASDVMFKTAAELEAIYPTLLRHGMIVSDSPAVLRYLGKRQPESSGLGPGSAPQEILSDCRRRYEGVRIKHWINHNSVKAYNKSASILRLETTINNTREFKVFRAPENHPERELSWQKLRKGVADLHRRCQISDASNERYGEALAAAVVEEKLGELVKGACRRVVKAGRSFRALNPWNELDDKLLTFLSRGELAINGFRNKDLRAILEPRGGAAVGDEVRKRRLSAKATRCLGLLRAHGLIKKVPRTSRYVLTEQGRKFTTALLSASATDVKKLMELAA